MDSFLIILQIVSTSIIALYFFSQMKDKKGKNDTVSDNSFVEMKKIKALEQQKLNIPLSEKARPSHFDEIIGQQEGVAALKAAICSENPQHVLIYGPPGVGKTCAARLALEEAKRQRRSPFKMSAPMIEIDATCVRFDERSIADPLIGSVHDPIYQGAGAYGPAGIPQPKMGAVTKANGGVLFLDEIGELHSMQMNKLLKVLEDRKVSFESAYYNEDDKNIPEFIHYIFKNGLPADFRLIGATTRQPNEIPSAIRSRCIEIFFTGLKNDEIETIAKNAAIKHDINLCEKARKRIASYCHNGREVVNMIQIASGVAIDQNRREITESDIDWVARVCQYRQKYDKKINKLQRVGFSNALAVTPEGQGVLFEIESVIQQALSSKLQVNGIVESEEIDAGNRKIIRKGTAKASAENVLTALKNCNIANFDYSEVYINFPGGIPVDGPSAGVAMAISLYSAYLNLPADNFVASTGEISIAGYIKPVGGVVAKIEAAIQAGAKKVLIPKDNFSECSGKKLDIDIIPISHISQAFEVAFSENDEELESPADKEQVVLIAKPQ